MGLAAPSNEVDCMSTLLLEATTSSGAPVNLGSISGIGGSGPYIKVMIPSVTTDQSGLVIGVGGTYINNNSSVTVRPGESVAGLVMDYVDGLMAITDGGMATAAVAGTGQAYTGTGQNVN